MNRIKVVNMNEALPNTCGSCEHTQNDLGVVAIHCNLLYEKGLESKVRSYEKCCFNPSKYKQGVQER